MHFEHHRQILQILSCLDSEFLLKCQTYFGGGTLVSLRHGEHRLSNDIDLVCSLQSGYSLLRRQLYADGYAAIFRDLGSLTLPRELQVSQYAVRFPVMLDEYQIRFEIVAEGQIALSAPEHPSWCPIACINATDSFSQKLMANADRWSDSRVHSRDLIDLAVQRLGQPIPSTSIEQAERWYPVLEPLVSSLQRFQASLALRQDCYELLQVRDAVMVANGLDLLALDLQQPLLKRSIYEQNDEIATACMSPLLSKFCSQAALLLQSQRVHSFSLEGYKIAHHPNQYELRVWESETSFPALVAKFSKQGWSAYHNSLSEQAMAHLFELVKAHRRDHRSDSRQSPKRGQHR